LENRLEAFPHEVAPTIDWAFIFERDAEGWRVASRSTA
jgi:hypothetical protein